MQNSVKKEPKPKELHSQGGTVPYPGGKDVPHTRVELMLSARNLKDKDVLSKSDPMCIVYLKMSLTENMDEPVFMEIDRTEIIPNNLNPRWSKKIQMDYFFETKQQLRFDLYDIDTKDARDLSRQDYLGRCECHLADVLAAPYGALTLNLINEPGQNGTLTIRAEEVDEGQKELLYMVCRGQQVASQSVCWCCFSTDPYLEFHRIYPNGEKQLVHRTEIQKTTNPEWRPIEINVRHLCERDKNKKFLIECYNYKNMKKHKLLGSVHLSVNELVKDLQHRHNLIMVNGQQLDGSLRFLRAEIRREYTWLDYIRGGMQLDFMVCIDFTLSNGDASLPSSRHYIDPRCMNQYEIAISSVLEICEHYNRTKSFEAFGFGARMPPSETTSHLFRLDNRQSTLHGVGGVINAYRSALHFVSLYGPTYFEPCIRYAYQKCLMFPRDGSRYQILLIITDGLIDDMLKTKLAIIEASDQPMSIIIIGVGDEDFSKMDELDSDESMLKQNGKRAKRDIVQFVPFRNFYGAVRSSNHKFTPKQQSLMQVHLAKTVLEEIPYQVTSYMKMHKITPMT